MHIIRIVPAAALALGMAALTTSAFAQSAVAPGAMPPPPSAADPTPKTTAPAKKATRSTKPKQDAVSTENTGRRSTDYRGRLEGDDMQLEDDPRVRPTMEGGRPGMGMRF